MKNFPGPGARRYAIIGAARSGVAVARLLHSRGEQVFVSDAAPAATMQRAAEELRILGIEAEFGGHTAALSRAEVLVLSPGVPTDSPVVREAAARGIPVVSEVEAAGWFCRSPIVAVTGTNGKTTTTTLIGRMLEDARRACAVGGNIGTAFSAIVDALAPDAVAVLEISSFQLDHIETFRPRVSVLLNITPDHLDRYGHSFERYAASKRRVYENQGEGDTLIYNMDDEVVRQGIERFSPHGVTLFPFSTRDTLQRGAWLADGVLTVALDERPHDIIPASEISIRGAHNLANAMAATLAARRVGVSAVSIRATLRNFKGVEHRLEFVREVDGVTYVNDSKATNVDSVWYALQSFEHPLIVLIGGRDKGNDYSRLLELVRSRVRGVVAIGESADRVESAFGTVVPVRRAGDMTSAVTVARNLSRPGDIVLLSPACASFDWFENYEHRGREFKRIVMALN